MSHLLIIVKSQSNQRSRGGLAQKQGPLYRETHLSGAKDEGQDERRRGEAGTNGGRGKEGKSVVRLGSCFSFCPDFFTQKHPSGAVLIMEHKIA